MEKYILEPYTAEYYDFVYEVKKECIYKIC